MNAYLLLSNFKTTIKQYTVARCICSIGFVIEPAQVDWLVGGDCPAPRPGHLKLN